VQTGGIFKPAKNLIEKLKEKQARAEAADAGGE
jgi:hypothetical protein